MTQRLVEKRKDFYMENIFVMKTGTDLANDIRQAVAKLLCTRCRLNYASWNLFTQYFNQAGCDDLNTAGQA